MSCAKASLAGALPSTSHFCVCDLLLSFYSCVTVLDLNGVVWDVERRPGLHCVSELVLALRSMKKALFSMLSRGGCFHQRRHISLLLPRRLSVAPPGGRAGALQSVSPITVAPTVVFAFTPVFLFTGIKSHHNKWSVCSFCPFLNGSGSPDVGKHILLAQA